MKNLILNRKCLLLIFIIFVMSPFGTDLYAANCKAGDILSPGQSCTYPGTSVRFSVNNDGSARMSNPPAGLPWLLQFLFGAKLNGSVDFNANINGKAYNFAAKELADGIWGIEEVGTSRAQPVLRSLSASVVSPLTEATLDESIVTLTLTGLIYEADVSKIRDAVAVSGINGVTVDPATVQRLSDTEITVALTFDGTDFDADATLTFNVASDAIVDYTGDDFTAEVPVTAIKEGVVASVVSPLTEATLEESVVTLTLTGPIYEADVSTIRDTVTVTGIDGVTADPSKIQRLSDTEITVALTFDGTDFDADATLTFNVGSGAMAAYTGDAFTAEVPVTAIKEGVVASVVSPLTEATLEESVVTLTLTDLIYESDVSKIRDAVAVSGINGVTVDPATVQRLSDTEITVALTFDGTDFDTDTALSFSVAAGAIANYTGDAFTAEVPVTASDVVKTPDPSNIYGPWLWMIAKGSNIDSDQLALVSRGGITENHVATHGVNEGDTVGRLQWTRGQIRPTTACKTKRTSVLGFSFTTRTCASNNVNELVNAIGLSQNSDINDYSAYALINIVSPRNQKGVVMGVGSDDTVKVWLNGEVVHTSRTGRSTSGIQDEFRVDLKAGDNLLLVKVCEYQGHWGMFFGIYLDDADFATAIPGEGSARTGTTPAVAEDVNNDGVVNIQDLVLVGSSLGKSGQTAADVNGDGVVNIADLVLVAGALGTNAAAPSLLHLDSSERLTSADVHLWLSQARHLPLTDAISRRGILFLEQLLAAMVPKETLLLANYPNPFNPETWIPYQLSKSADVTLTIYGIDGQIVRQLALGHQPAGMYQSRSRAAYWDGKNAMGEPVASGVYFYTLSTESTRDSVTAGDFSATRKMLIRK